MFEVRMPQWGMEMTEGTIIKWYKTEGQQVEKGEPIADIELAKTNGTLEAPCSGTLIKLVALEEETVPVQGLLATIDDKK